MASPTTATFPPFQTPILDTVRSNLLLQISTVGGYPYVTLSSSQPSTLFSAEASLDMAWEQLHSGPWHSVLPIWRDAYAMSCLHVASFQYVSGDFKEAIRVLDLGIIMGGNLLRQDLDSAIKLISKDMIKSKGHDVLGKEIINSVSSCSGDADADAEETMKVLLPKRSLCCQTVEKRSGLSLEGFLCDYFLRGIPVVISDAMSHWPACTKWKDVEYLKGVAGDRTVPVEVGKNYLCDDWKQELITFTQFLERIHTTDSISASPTYLAQHPLFEQIQELRGDIVVPDYCFVGGGELRSLNAWFGPTGTMTPLHHDPHHNIFAQVVGRKYIRLYPALISDDLYPYSESMLCNSSQVDLDNLDELKFPKAKDLDFVDCILEEGEMLYIPPKWWHYVRSLTMSFSVSFWWSEQDS